MSRKFAEDYNKLVTKRVFAMPLNSCPPHTGHETFQEQQLTYLCKDKSCRLGNLSEAVETIELNKIPRAIFYWDEGDAFQLSLFWHGGRWISARNLNYPTKKAGVHLFTYPLRDQSGVTLVVEETIKRELNLYFDGSTLQKFKLAGGQDGLFFSIDSKVKSQLKELATKGYFPFATTQDLKDPDVWKRSSAPEAVVSLAKRHYLKKFDGLNCESDSTSGIATINLKTKDLRIHPRQFKSRHGEMIFGLSPHLSLCRFPIGGMLDVAWYFSKNGKDIKFINSTSENLGPVDAADFDGDGKSEWIFREYTHDYRYLSIFSSDFELKNGEAIDP